MSRESLIGLRSSGVEAWLDPRRGYIHSIRSPRQTQFLIPEAVQAVYFHVRGPDWSTIMPDVTVSRCQSDGLSFHAEWSASTERLGVPFHWEGEAWSDGDRVIIAARGVATDDFLTCRTGLCVLLPQELEGWTATAIGPTGNASRKFPLVIRHIHPFTEFQSLEAPLADLHFSGANFEIEDQRNWGDASFKAYPLAPPSPYAVTKGSRIEHKVEIILKEGPRQPASVRDTLASPLSWQGRWCRLSFSDALPSAPPSCEATVVEDSAAEGVLDVSVHPQTHIFDDRLILRNADALLPIVRSLRFRQPKAKVRIHLHWGAENDPRLGSEVGRAWASRCMECASAGGAEEVIGCGFPSNLQDHLTQLVKAPLRLTGPAGDGAPGFLAPVL